MQNKVTFLYAKEFNGQEYFEISSGGKIISTTRQLGQLHLREKASIFVVVDRDVMTKRQVLGVLPAVLDLKRAFELEKLKHETIPSPFLRFNLNNDSLNVLINKEDDVSFQEMSVVVDNTLKSIMETPEDYFLKRMTH